MRVAHFYFGPPSFLLWIEWEESYSQLLVSDKSFQTI